MNHSDSEKLRNESKKKSNIDRSKPFKDENEEQIDMEGIEADPHKEENKSKHLQLEIIFKPIEFIFLIFLKVVFKLFKSIISGRKQTRT